MYSIIHLDQTDSTNSYLRTVVNSDEPVCVIADRQTAGRGRLGRTFESPVGGLYMSFTCRTADAVNDAVTAKAAVAAARAVERLTGLHIKIKWVNDLYAGDKKLCGILSEGVWRGPRLDYIIIGIGVNLYGELPEQLCDIATTVEKQGGRIPDREELARAILEEFDGICDFYEEYKERQLFLGCTVTVHRGEEIFTAEAVDIGSDCSLILRLEDGCETALSSGEISVRRKEND